MRLFHVVRIASQSAAFDDVVMRIRQARPVDLLDLRPLFDEMGFVDSPENLVARFPRFCGRADAPLTVCEVEGRVVGYAWCQDYGQRLRSGDRHRTAKLHDLCTHPDFRRQGVGSALMRAAVDWARADGIRYLFWYADEGSATDSYRAMGYRDDETGQEGFQFFEVDLGDPTVRAPHPTRGS